MKRRKINLCIIAEDYKELIKKAYKEIEKNLDEWQKIVYDSNSVFLSRWQEE